MKKVITRLVSIGGTIFARDSVCPFCGKRHITLMYINIICDCGAKFYVRTCEWLNRKTGAGLKATEIEVEYVPSDEVKEN